VKSKSKSSGKKPSPAQLAARKKFAAMAKERAAEAKKSGSGKSNIGKSKSKRPAAIAAPEQRKSSLRSFKMKKAKPLATRKSRSYASGPASNMDDVHKVTLRTPTLELAPVADSRFEIDINGAFTKLGF